MQSKINSLPIDERADAIQEMNSQLRAGTLDILVPYRDSAEQRSFEQMMTKIQYTAGVSVVGVAALAAFTTVSPVLLSAAVAGLAVTALKKIRERRAQDIRDISRDKFGHILVDSELEELDGLLEVAGKPSSSAIAQSYQRAKAIIETEMLVIDDDDEPVSLAGTSDAIDAQAVEVEDGLASQFGSVADGFDLGDLDAMPAAPIKADLTMIDDETALQSAIPTFNHLGKLQPLFEADGSPSRALMAFPLKERAQLLLSTLKSAGCDIEYYMNRPAFAAGGLPRTAKSTLLVLMGLFEKAVMGRKLYYITADDDVFPVSFDGVASGSPAVARKGFLKFADTVKSAGVGQLSDQTWILDEFAVTVAGFDNEEKERLWSTALTGMQKRQGRGRYVLHGMTSTMCGVPSGWADIFKQSLIVSRGEKAELRDGTDKPTGRYELYRSKDGKELSGTGKYISIPDWLKSKSNTEYGDLPCPVRTVLLFMPELDSRLMDSAVPQLIEQEQPKPMQAIEQAPQQSAAPEDVGGDTFTATALQVSVNKDAIAHLLSEPAQIIDERQFIETVADEPLIEGTRYTMTQVIQKVADIAKEAAGSSVTVRGADGIGRKFSGADRPGLKRAKAFESAMNFLARHYPARYKILQSADGQTQIYFIQESEASAQPKSKSSAFELKISA